GRLEEEASHYETSLQLKPRAHLTHKNLGAVLAELERYGEAQRHLQEAISLKPDYGIAYFQLGELARRGHFRFADSDLAQMEMLANDARSTADDRSQIHFTLADALDRQGQYEQAF